MNGRGRWKVKDLAWRKKYKRYHDEVLEYEFYAMQKFSIHNTIVFLIYGIISFFWNRYFIEESVTGSFLCFGICLLSVATYIACRTYLVKHIEKVTLAVNIYIILLGKMILSIDLVWNQMHGGNVSWTLLLCSLFTTTMICIVPSHYGISILVMVALDTIECIAAHQGLIDTLYNLLDGILISIFSISMNVIYSGYQYAEFSRKDELQMESSRDQLTQLYNRRYIERYFGIHAKAEKLCAIMVLDLDNFKMANDVYGHKKGDEVLCTVSELLRKSFRNGDCVARLGGDEFAVFLPEISNKDAMEERIHEVLEKFPIVIEGEIKVNVSVSIGIAYKNPGEEPDYVKLCNKADEAMYRAKNMGKGKAVINADRHTKEKVIAA